MIVKVSCVAVVLDIQNIGQLLHGVVVGISAAVALGLDHGFNHKLPHIDITLLKLVERLHKVKPKLPVALGDLRELPLLFL